MLTKLTAGRVGDYEAACAYERVFGSEILALLRQEAIEEGENHVSSGM